MRKNELEEISKEKILELMPQCSSRKELAIKLGFVFNGGKMRTFRKMCKFYNIDLTVYDTKLTKEKYYNNPKYCLQCGKLIPYEKRENKFCSSSCAAVYNNTGRVRNKKTREKKSRKLQEKNNGEYKSLPETADINGKRYCKFCGKELARRNDAIFCSLRCQQRYHQEEYVKRWKRGEENGIKGEYGISNHIRRYLLEKYDCKCQKCGWGIKNEYTNKYPLEVHHIDGDYTNNKEENLQLLCPNCHSLTETYKSHNKNGRKSRGIYS